MTRYPKTLILAVLMVALAGILVWVWYGGYGAGSFGMGGGYAAASRSTATNTAPHIILTAPASSQGSAIVAGSQAGSNGISLDGNTASTPSVPYYGAADTAGSVFVRIATTSVPVFERESYVVRDVTNGVTLASMNQNDRWPTASLTKLMTATLVLDHFSMNTEITITPKMMAVDPTQVALQIDGTYTVYDLLHAMLMPSNNVAAEAFADYYGYDKFMAAMNARAAAWGMTDTHFDDPSGLSSANESSAHDLAILATHVYQNYPQILAISNTPTYTLTNIADGGTRQIASINEFAGTPGFLGGKTGYIPESRDNLISLFRVDGHPLLIVVLGAKDTAARFLDTTALLDWVRTDYN
jgi:D-alanyl-D-alanine endopeptidase (penicillin-binding protein 7)